MVKLVSTLLSCQTSLVFSHASLVLPPHHHQSYHIVLHLPSSTGYRSLTRS